MSVTEGGVCTSASSASSDRPEMMTERTLGSSARPINASTAGAYGTAADGSSTMGDNVPS